MAWDFLRKFLKLVGGKMMAKLAPRLLLFQYYDRVNLEIQQQKKKYRVLFHKSQAELRIYRMLYAKTSNKLGISSILQERLENASEVSALQVNGFSDFADDRTVSSHYEDDDSLGYQFIELQAFRYAGNRALYRTYDYNPYFTEIEQGFKRIDEIQDAGMG